VIGLDLGVVDNCSNASPIDRDQGDRELYQQLRLGNEAQHVALTSDAGLWEYREREEVHTFSTAMCWAAHDRLSLIAKRVGGDAKSREWLALAGRLRQKATRRAAAQEDWIFCVLARDIDALAGAGRRPPALELLNDRLALLNHIGLLSEDIEPQTGELSGNFPQTYSQVGPILSAMRLSRSWEEGLWHAS
jgi:GH15 family glucan-1,4-alpha-glucosidase